MLLVAEWVAAAAVQNSHRSAGFGDNQKSTLHTCGPADARQAPLCSGACTFTCGRQCAVVCAEHGKAFVIAPAAVYSWSVRDDYLQVAG
jgi:hypothetical protein